MMYSSKLIQSGQNGDDAWTRYEMQPLGSLSLSPDQEPSEFVSLRVDSDNPVDFIPLVDDPVDERHAGNDKLNRQDTLALQEKEAYEKGFAQGEKDGLELGEAKASRLISNLEVLLDEIRQLKHTIGKQYEKEIVDLVYAIAKKIVHTHLNFNETAVRDTIGSALELTAEKRDIVLKINPEDFEYVEKIRPELFSKQPNLKSLTVTPDAAVGRGGCLLETPTGDVDATIETQLERIHQSLSEAYLG